MTTHSYMRVSTDLQDHQSQRTAIESSGLLIDQWHEDVMSGSKTSRPALDALLDVVRPGDTIVVFRLDRLGRSMQHLVNLVLDLADRGITVRSLSEQLDTSNTMGRMMLAMMAGMAELEREAIKDRVRAAYATRRARGDTLGNVESLNAHRKRGSDTIKQRTAEQAESLRWAIEPLVEEGMTFAAMADVLNEREIRAPSGSKWNRKSVSRVAGRLAA